MLYIGIDDTDSVRGMCTTYLLTEVIKELMEEGMDIIGYPKLVRLNPNIPWKTRGNAALAVAAGYGKGTKKKFAEIDGKPVFLYFREGKHIESEIEERIFCRISSLVERYGRFEEENTNPGIVILRKKPPYRFYMKGVRGIVDKKEVLGELQHLGGRWKEYKNGRGIIGSFCAVAWKPLRHTFEILAYREKWRWGTPRHIDESSVIEMDKKFRTTFNNYDYENSRVVIAPHSPCPILFGIRATLPDELISAMYTVRADEPVDRWCIFQTNQGTDDHILRARIADCEPGLSVRIRGVVVWGARSIAGGHVIFHVSDGSGEIDCTVYEPSKEFTGIARRIIEGDFVEVFGAVRSNPRTINVEKLHIIKAEPLVVKLENPVCSKCGKHMKSRGNGMGYECKRCHTRAPENAANYQIIDRKNLEGFYEPAVSSRRHLAKPLKLLLGV